MAHRAPVHFIFIRHGDRAWKNTSKNPNHTPKYDPPLIPGQEKKITDKRNRLKKFFGPPKKIISSPYVRCAETAKLLGEEGQEIIFDPRIAEYLGWQTNSDMTLFDGRTLDIYKKNGWDPPTNGVGGENAFDVGQRAKELIQEYITKSSPGDVYWIVTHGIVISQISGGFYPKYLEYYDHKVWV